MGGLTLERQRADAGRPRVLLTSFGYRDPGGGTIVPRQLARELARRGWDVTVFHAAVARLDGAPAYAVREWREDGVRLVGVHNRPHGLLDLGHPEREIDDPPITRAFADLLDRLQPDVVHFHNLHNLGAALIDEVAARGLPSVFSTHNYWLICPRNYLFTEGLDLCPGPGDGSACAACVGSRDGTGYERRLAELRGRASRGLGRVLAVSEAMRNTLIAAGYPAGMIDVVHQAMPQEQQIWEALGRDRQPGRVADQLVVGFFGSALPHKGPSLLADAAQLTGQPVSVRIFGELPAAFAAALRQRDRRGVVELRGAFSHDQLPELLAGVDVAVIPSLWWDCAPLMVRECLAGRVPVLAARMGGIPDLVRDGQDGLLHAGRDAADLARQLDRLAGEPGLVEALQAGIQPPPPFSAYVDELEAYYRGGRPGRETAGDATTSVAWRGDHSSLQSLAVVNREVCDRLAVQPGVALARIDRQGRGETLPLPAQVEVRHQFPPDLTPARSGRLALIQPWEFGAVPRDWVAPIRRHVDELWAPSEYVRRMYLEAGIPAERVVVVPNGVDLDRFQPDGPALELETGPGTVFLFVGGLISRKGPDLAVAAYQRVFAGRDDVTLVIKDFGADSIYGSVDRSRLREWADAGRLPRIVYRDGELSADDMAALYRRCDVLLHPYRGEGFGMPVLEAMACGLPVIVTGGGPTDEFVPDAACWRVRSHVRHEPVERYEHIETHGLPYLLEPDGEHLCHLLDTADRDRQGRLSRGRAATAAARELSWDAVAERYRERIELLAARPPLAAAADGPPLELDEAAHRLLAVPAWLGADRLGDLLEAWVECARPESGACLFLLADPRTAGSDHDTSRHVLDTAATHGVALDGCADITILRHPLAGGEEPRLHAAVDAYVQLGPAGEGHARLAAQAGNPVLQPTTESIAAWLD